MPGKFERSADEMDSGVLAIKSEVWQTKNGFVWEVWHLNSKWRAEGVSTTVAEAYDDIMATVTAALAEAEVEVAGKFRLSELRITRTHLDAG